MAMETQTTSSIDFQLPSSIITPETRGKHRLIADLKRLEQETRFLEEELEALERTDKVSAVCPELLLSVKTKPDALLPETSGPINPSWDRWFEGPQDSKGCKCWFF